MNLYNLMSLVINKHRFNAIYKRNELKKIYNIINIISRIKIMITHSNTYADNIFTIIDFVSYKIKEKEN